MTSDSRESPGGCAIINGLEIDYISLAEPGANPKAGFSSVIGPNFPFGRWIIFLGHFPGDSYLKILIGRDGKMLPDEPLPEYRSANWVEAGSERYRQAIQAQTEVAYRYSSELARQEARQLESEAHRQAHQFAREAAQESRLCTHDVLQNMPEAFLFRIEQYHLRESATKRILALTGMTAESLTQLKLTHQHYRKVPGFTAAAHTVAKELPELGFAAKDSKTPAAVWELIGTDPRPLPQLHDWETVEQTASWMCEVREIFGAYSPFDPNETTSFAYGFGGMDEILIGK